MLKRLKLGNLNKWDPFTLRIGTNSLEKIAHTIFTQYREGQMWPVAMITCKKQEQACKGRPVDIYLRLTAWEVRSLFHYTIYPLPMYIVTSDTAISLLVVCRIENVRAMAIELSIYNI